MEHPPPADGAEVANFTTQVKSFDAFAGVGPSGLRSQIIKKFVWETGDEEMSDATKLFVEGRVPRFLRQWYAGSTLITLSFRVWWTSRTCIGLSSGRGRTDQLPGSYPP